MGIIFSGLCVRQSVPHLKHKHDKDKLKGQQAYHAQLLIYFKLPIPNNH